MAGQPRLPRLRVRPRLRDRPRLPEPGRLLLRRVRTEQTIHDVTALAISIGLGFYSDGCDPAL